MKFREDGAAAIIVDDAGKDLYDAQVEEQMAAAAAQASLCQVKKSVFTQQGFLPPCGVRGWCVMHV